MSRWVSTHSFTLKKTGSYYITHITVAAMVAYAVTGDWLAAVTLSLLEPSVQAVVYFFHERLWQSAGGGVKERAARAHRAAPAAG